MKTVYIVNDKTSSPIEIWLMMSFDIYFRINIGIGNDDLERRISMAETIKESKEGETVLDIGEEKHRPFLTMMQTDEFRKKRKIFPIIKNFCIVLDRFGIVKRRCSETVL